MKKIESNFEDPKHATERKRFKTKKSSQGNDAMRTSTVTEPPRPLQTPSEGHDFGESRKSLGISSV